ncbi:hypothetical protein, partial [Helicobacter pullorum]|uniref:hypothetical protein n=1 Tax=Helicobacter pullorum TaxID=35818 RepID=UPI00174D6F54
MSLNQGTITGDISLTGSGANVDATSDTDNTRTATIGEITLENSSTITGNINIKGNSADNNAKIGSITLGNNTGIGGSIAVGDTGDIKGTIDAITLKGNSTIAGGIINNANGNIGTIVSNTGTNINNTITNEGTIKDLVVSKGTITYIDSNNSGVVDSLLQVEDGATLKMGANGNGTITIGSDLGSVLDLQSGSTFEGNLKNASAIKEWKNESNIRGSFINASDASVGDLIAGQISQNLSNEGEITNLTIDKTIGGTLINDNGGVINTLIIQDNSNINNGITNNSNIGSLNLQENVTYNGSGSITNALDI